MQRLLGVCAVVLTGLMLAGCSGATKAQKGSGSSAQTVEADEQVLKLDPLERNYDPHVIMKRAESFYEKEDYAEAGVEYQHFLDLHKTHVLAPYAQYRLGLSAFKQVTTRDRDPEPVRRSLEAMEKLLKEYSDSSYEDDARSKIKECREHLAAYELYVGKHYYHQTAYLAALHRFEALIAQYPDSEAFAEAVYYLGRTYADIGAKERAIEQLTNLVKQYPKRNDKATRESRLLLAKLTKQPLQDIVASSRPSAKPSIPPPLPNGNTWPQNTPALLPSGADGLPVVTCALNVSC